MPKFYALVVVFLFFVLTGKAQTVPLEKRNVNGMVRDTLGKGIPFVTVQLLSSKDTLSISTSEYGNFNFKNVRSAEFTIKVQGLSYAPFVQKYFNNDTKPQITLQPIVMDDKSNQLEDVIIDAVTGPRQRGDTTEFWAKDYIVREYSRLEDLLRRLEGVTIEADGSVFYNNEPVVKALFNGEGYFSGNVQEIMKELPADIVERIQIIDTRADGNGPRISASDKMVKALNVVTKPDKSAGKMYVSTNEVGGKDHYSLFGSARFIDGFEQKSVQVKYNNEPVGIRKGAPVGSISRGNLFSMGGSNASSGIGRNLSATTRFNQIAGIFSFSHSYNFAFKNDWNSTENMSEEFYNEGNLVRNIYSDRISKGYSHAWNSTYDFQLKNGSSFNGYIRLNYETSTDENRVRMKQTGFVNNLEERLNGTDSKIPSYNFNMTYQPSFTGSGGSKQFLMITLGSSFVQNSDKRNEELNVYLPQQSNPDSSLHLFRKRDDNRFMNSFFGVYNYTLNEQLRINGNISFMQESGKQSLRTDQIVNLTQFRFLDSLSNHYRYQKVEGPASFSFEYDFTKSVLIKAGLNVINNWISILQGAPTINNVLRFSNNVLPFTTLTYNINKQSSLKLNYMTISTNPSIQQLDPRKYYTEAFAVNMGNPDLKNTLTSTALLIYGNFFQKQRINISLNGKYTNSRNSIALNRITKVDAVSQTLSSESRYVNVDGNSSYGFQYGISKNFKTMNISIKWNGGAQWARSSYFSDNIPQLNENVSSNNALIMQITPASWLELSPNLNYRTYSSDNSLALNRAIFNNELSANITGRLFFPKEFSMEFNLDQNLARGTNIPTNTSPFVINMNIEKRVFKQRNGVISLVVMDLMKENSFVQIQNYENGYSNTLTNPKSRYFLLQFSWQPQSWGKSKHASDTRKGDGSFVK